MRYALVKNGIVVNVEEWNGVSPYKPDGELVRIDDQVDIGYLYDGKVFTAPEETKDVLREIIKYLKTFKKYVSDMDKAATVEEVKLVLKSALTVPEDIK